MSKNLIMTISREVVLGDQDEEKIIKILHVLLNVKIKGKASRPFSVSE
jgi:hypothetical protein